jgi:hypothetical protein
VPAGIVEVGPGSIELAHHVVSQVDGIREVLEPDRILGEAGDRKP